jgi:hypothetical protein
VVDLKLGPLPEQNTVKVTIELPEPLKEELDAYAAEHGKIYSRPTKTAELIPHCWRRTSVRIVPGALAENRGGRGKPGDIGVARPATQT